MALKGLDQQVSMQRLTRQPHNFLFMRKMIRVGGPPLAKNFMLMFMIGWLTSSFFLISSCFANSSGLPIPRFASLRSSEINLRRGPGTRYPIDWIFVRAGLPVEIISEFETWRKIRDIEGTEGWVHQSMLSGKRTVMTPLFQKPVFLMKNPDRNARPVARLQGGVIASLKKCTQKWCYVEAQTHKGWLHKDTFWGLRENETIQ